MKFLELQKGLLRPEYPVERMKKVTSHGYTEDQTRKPENV